MSMRMKNQSAAAKRKSVVGDSSGESCAESSDEASGGDETLPDRSAMKDCFENLKYILVDEKNRLEIERKLQFSRAYRNELLKVPETDLLESFPYFFADPKLVTHLYIIDMIFEPISPTKLILQLFRFCSSTVILSLTLIMKHTFESGRNMRNNWKN